MCCIADKQSRRRIQKEVSYRIHTKASRTRIPGYRAVTVPRNGGYYGSNVLRCHNHYHHKKGTARLLVPKRTATPIPLTPRKLRFSSQLLLKAHSSYRVEGTTRFPYLRTNAGTVPNQQNKMRVRKTNGNCDDSLNVIVHGTRDCHHFDLRVIELI